MYDIQYKSIMSYWCVLGTYALSMYAVLYIRAHVII